MSRAEYSAWLENLKPRAEDVVNHGFFWVPGTSCPAAYDPGTEYERYTTWTDGVAANLCATDWVPDLELMFDWLNDTARVSLPETPSEPPTVYFVENGSETLLDPADYTWDVDSLTVYFDQGTRPPITASVRVEYTPL